MSARAALAAALLTLVAACGSPRRSEPLVGAFTPTSTMVERGERVFMTNCHACHPGGEAGVGPALNNKPLPGALIRLQVRAGLGAMPAFTAADIPDPDVEALLAYLRARR